MKEELESIEYSKLKDNIDKVNISFSNINAIYILDIINDKYDLILLSNILDYFN